MGAGAEERGIRMLREGGLEACNKLLRNYRTTKARKSLNFSYNVLKSISGSLRFFKLLC